MDELKQLKISVQSPEDMQQMALRSENARQSQVYASERAALMFGCYRKAEASDPEIYAAAMAAILSEYPKEVIDYVTDPRTGLPRTNQWLPSVFEAQKACEEHMKFLEKLKEAKKRGIDVTKFGRRSA